MKTPTAPMPSSIFLRWQTLLTLEERRSNDFFTVGKIWYYDPTSYGTRRGVFWLQLRKTLSKLQFTISWKSLEIEKKSLRQKATSKNRERPPTKLFFLADDGASFGLWGAYSKKGVRHEKRKDGYVAVWAHMQINSTLSRKEVMDVRFRFWWWLYK